MEEVRNLTEENVEELKEHLERMKKNNPDLEYRFFDQMEENSKLNDLKQKLDDVKSEFQDLKNRASVKDPFAWMRSWLEAYARNHDDINVGKIMDWIFRQPMTGG